MIDWWLYIVWKFYAIQRTEDCYRAITKLLTTQLLCFFMFAGVVLIKIFDLNIHDVNPYVGVISLCLVLALIYFIVDLRLFTIEKYKRVVKDKTYASYTNVRIVMTFLPITILSLTSPGIAIWLLLGK